MKTSTLFFTFLSAVDVATAEMFVVGPPDWSQTQGLNMTEMEQPRLQARQRGSKTQLKNRTPHVPKSKSVKIRYGPFTVRGGGTAGGEGMIWNQPTPSVAKPCSNCYIVGMNAGLEYTDGRDANTESGLWLHHMVLFNIGKNTGDATCRGMGLPHMIVGTTVANSERFFSSGNERTPVFFNPPWTNSSNIGYPVFPRDRFGLITDLMNMNPGAKTVYLVMYYDWVDGHPTNFKELKPVWFDVAQCGISEVGGRAAGSKFTINAAPWTANFNGEVHQAGGHLHDGGVAVDLLADGKNVCKSTATYAGDAAIMARARAIIKGQVPSISASLAADSGAKPAKAMKGMGNMNIKHIMAMSICSEHKGDLKGMPVVPWGIKQVKRGQRWVLRASYDYRLHPGMKKKSGGMQSIMGIAIMFVKTANRRAG